MMKWVTWYISPLFSDSFSRGENYTVDLWRSVKETKGMAFQFVKEMDEAGVDVLLTPGFPGPGTLVCLIIGPQHFSENSCLDLLI